MTKMERIGGGFGRRVTAQTVREVTAALFEAGETIANDAALSITEGSQGGAGHVVSRPGEPPNANTGELDRSIGARSPAPMVVEVFASADHALPLEFGTSKMAARPFMRPAGDRGQPEVKARLVQAMKKIAAGGKVTR